MAVSTIIDRLEADATLQDDELAALLATDRHDGELFAAADRVRRHMYGTDVYVRGLIEFSNHCRNDCLYCGIRHSNARAERYRLSREDIAACCRQGYALGFRTFVLQSGEDPLFTDDLLCEIVADIRKNHEDCAITLSVGEKSRESYAKLFEAGANRYLLRHETADEDHYRRLHPAPVSGRGATPPSTPCARAGSNPAASMRLETRKECLWNLKAIGYQVGSGFMVGSPWQTTEHLLKDLRFLQALQPDMIGIGPFIRHQDTPLRKFANGDLRLCLRLVAILRLMFPRALIPATTALGTIAPDGREQGLRAGANVLMPNLSPARVRKLYQLYDDKICTGEEAAECRDCLDRRVRDAGYQIVVSRGDSKQRVSSP
jgi:biotin synthase